MHATCENVHIGQERTLDLIKTELQGCEQPKMGSQTELGSSARAVSTLKHLGGGGYRSGLINNNLKYAIWGTQRERAKQLKFPMQHPLIQLPLRPGRSPGCLPVWQAQL